jgi:hypothetical protein
VNIGTEFSDLGTLVDVVARSPIAFSATAVDRSPIRDHRPLPSGFDEVDVAVLEWIAAEGRRVGRRLGRI